MAKSRKRRTVYVVETLFGYVWEDCWGRTFATSEHAKAAIQELIEDTREAFALGYIAEEYDVADYRVRAVRKSKNG
jgi:hypothetical protein